jgi:hypothetical protein
LDNLFIGRNGFLWFFGAVENNADPLGIGRVQIRIVGHHADKSLIPTEALPWAIVVHSPDNPIIGGTGHFSSIPIGSRVFGFFTDSETRQSPVVLGILAGEKQSVVADSVPSGATYNMPNLDNLLSKVLPETECPSGDTGTSVTVNQLPIDEKLIKINKSEWCYPVGGFVSAAYKERNGRHHGVDICPLLPQTNVGNPILNGMFRTGVGAPVYAPADGTVVHIWNKFEGQGGVSTNYDAFGNGSRSYGNAIAIRHDTSTGVFTTILAHLGTAQDAHSDGSLSGINVSVGQKVTKGQQIGTVGATHNFRQPIHLHFEVRYGAGMPRANNHINPALIFPKLAARNNSFLGWVNSQLKYDVTIPFAKSDMPIKEKEAP